MKSFVLTLSATLLLVSVGYQQHKVPVLGHHVVSQLSRWTRYTAVCNLLAVGARVARVPVTRQEAVLHNSRSRIGF